LKPKRLNFKSQTRKPLLRVDKGSTIRKVLGKQRLQEVVAFNTWKKEEKLQVGQQRKTKQV